MGFKSLFKVRQPGHGSKFEGRVKRAISKARGKKVDNRDNSFVSKGKKVVA